MALSSVAGFVLEMGSNTKASTYLISEFLKENQRVNPSDLTLFGESEIDLPSVGLEKNVYSLIIVKS